MILTEPAPKYLTLFETRVRFDLVYWVRFILCFILTFLLVGMKSAYIPNLSSPDLQELSFWFLTIFWMGVWIGWDGMGRVVF